MRLNLKVTLGRLKISLRAGLVTSVLGVNSNVEGGGHIIMWEFDTTNQVIVMDSLREVQKKFALPRISIAKSSASGGFHAYCLNRTEWIRSIHIVSGTYGVDPGYINMCAMRGHWTLRLSDKGDGAPDFVDCLPSMFPETVAPNELWSGDIYEVFDRKVTV